MSGRIEVCKCGCQRSDHDDLAMPGGMVIDRGHGACLRCNCRKFTYDVAVTEDDGEPDAFADLDPADMPRF